MVAFSVNNIDNVKIQTHSGFGQSYENHLFSSFIFRNTGHTIRHWVMENIIYRMMKVLECFDGCSIKVAVERISQLQWNLPRATTLQKWKNCTKKSRCGGKIILIWKKIIFQNFEDILEYCIHQINLKILTFNSWKFVPLNVISIICHEIPNISDGNGKWWTHECTTICICGI